MLHFQAKAIPERRADRSNFGTVTTTMGQDECGKYEYECTPICETRVWDQLFWRDSMPQPGGYSGITIKCSPEFVNQSNNVRSQFPCQRSCAPRVRSETKEAGSEARVSRTYETPYYRPSHVSSESIQYLLSSSFLVCTCTRTDLFNEGILPGLSIASILTLE